MRNPLDIGHMPAGRGELTARRLSMFLVENEVLIRMMLKDMVESFGHAVTAEAGYLTEALELAKTATFDLAIIDINLGGDNSLPVAKAVAARGFPFIVSTAYGIDSVTGLFGSSLMIQKPFLPARLQAAIAEAIGQN